MFGGNPASPAPAPASAPAATAPAQFSIPDSAYILPSDTSSDYWKGFLAGMAARVMIPSPANLPPDQYGNGWQPYRDQRIFPMYRSSASGGYPIPFNDGFNDALESGALYRYLNDKTSAHFVVYP